MIVWRLLGRVLFILGYPFLAYYLSRDERARVIVINDDQVLLVRAWVGNGNWEAPGGGLHSDEIPQQGAARELSEELGFEVAVSNITLRQTEKHSSGIFTYISHYLVAKLTSRPELRLQRVEILDAQWFSIDELNGIPINSRFKEIVTEVLQEAGRVV